MHSAEHARTPVPIGTTATHAKLTENRYLQEITASGIFWLSRDTRPDTGPNEGEQTEMITPQTATAAAIVAYHESWNRTSNYALSDSAARESAQQHTADSPLSAYAPHYASIAIALFAGMEEYEYQIDGSNEEDAYHATRRELTAAIEAWTASNGDETAARAVIHLAQCAADVPEDDRISIRK